MTKPQAYTRTFHDLHVRGRPLVFNIWDAGSARAVADAGAKAIATGSWSVAAAHGLADGEQLPLELLLANLERIVKSVDLPVTCDLESGYGSAPEVVAETVRRTLETGAVGINLEDQVIGGEGLYSAEAQAARIRAARGAAEEAGVHLFINARTDIFLQLEPSLHDDKALDAAVRRADAYAEAGASGFFAPGLRNADLIRALCSRSPLPVNIMVLPDTPPPEQLAGFGVARISYGPGPYRQMAAALTGAAREALSHTDTQSSEDLSRF